MALSCERLHEAVSAVHAPADALAGLRVCRLIAGTYTPLCMLALDRATATRLLCIEWGAAFLGMVRPCRIRAEHVAASYEVVALRFQLRHTGAACHKGAGHMPGRPPATSLPWISLPYRRSSSSSSSSRLALFPGDYIQASAPA